MPCSRLRVSPAVARVVGVAARRPGGGVLLTGIEDSLLEFITGVYNAIGWPGVIVMMAIESAAIPLPSELIMPLAGWKLIQAKGRGFEWVLLAGFFGAVGNTAGSWIAYYAGRYGGRPFTEKYGKYILVSRHDLDLADRFFNRWGKWAVFGAPASRGADVYQRAGGHFARADLAIHALHVHGCVHLVYRPCLRRV